MSEIIFNKTNVKKMINKSKKQYFAYDKELGYMTNGYFLLKVDSLNLAVLSSMFYRNDSFTIHREQFINSDLFNEVRKSLKEGKKEYRLTDLIYKTEKHQMRILIGENNIYINETLINLINNNILHSEDLSITSDGKYKPVCFKYKNDIIAIILPMVVQNEKYKIEVIT